MGVAHRDAAVVGRAVPSRVGAHRARRAAGRELPGLRRERRTSVAPVRRARGVVRPDVLARRRRLRGRGPGAARSSGALDEEDVSLTYDAGAARGPPAPARPRPRWSATTCSRCSRDARGAATPATRRCSWVGYLGYACRPDLPARHRRPACPTRCGCGSRDPLFVDPRPGGRAAPAAGRRGRRRARPGRVRDAFAEVQRAAAARQQLRGQPDLPRGVRLGRRPGRRPTSGCGRPTPRRTPGSCSTSDVRC